MTHYTIVKTQVYMNPYSVVVMTTTYADDYDYKWAMNKLLYASYQRVATRFTNDGTIEWMYTEVN